MWILRYLILATRQRCNGLLDRRTRMTFDPLHGCAMHVCADKAEWDRRGKEQVAQLESELRQDIEAFNTKTEERRKITGETIEVRPVVTQGGVEDARPEPAEAGTTLPGSQNTLPREQRTEETILLEAAPETEAATASMGDALVSSGVAAQAGAEPGAEPTFLEEAKDGFDSGKGMKEQGNDGISETEKVGAARPEPPKGGTTLLPEDGGGETVVPEEVKPKAKTKTAGKAGKK
jgi:hypothetical protein